MGVSQHLDNTSPDVPTDEGVIEVEEDVFIHWWKYERDSSTITFVLHGGPEGHTEWMRVGAEELADELGTVVFYDRRGCGESSRGIDLTNIGYEQEVTDLSKVISNISANGRRIIVLGHSFGSTIALQPSLYDVVSVDGVILSAPFLGLSESENDFNSGEPIVCPEAPVRIEKEPECDDGIYAAWEENEDYLEQSHYASLEMIDIPILAVGGTCDWLYTNAVERRIRYFNNQALTYRYPLGSHIALFDNPAAFRDSIKNFLKIVQ
jgi:pimeloyl-ACP methyl ester carboxylesterase